MKVDVSSHVLEELGVILFSAANLSSPHPPACSWNRRLGSLCLLPYALNYSSLVQQHFHCDSLRATGARLWIRVAITGNSQKSSPSLPPFIFPLDSLVLDYLDQPVRLLCIMPY